jgi:hypothetical protein
MRNVGKDKEEEYKFTFTTYIVTVLTYAAIHSNKFSDKTCLIYSVTFDNCIIM